MIVSKLRNPFAFSSVGWKPFPSRSKLSWNVKEKKLRVVCAVVIAVFFSFYQVDHGCSSWKSLVTTEMLGFQRKMIGRNPNRSNLNRLWLTLLPKTERGALGSEYSNCLTDNFETPKHIRMKSLCESYWDDNDSSRELPPEVPVKNSCCANKKLRILCK